MQLYKYKMPVKTKILKLGHPIRTLSGVAQPSLTRAIKKMEAELGGSLFNRDRTNTRLSNFGMLVQSELMRIDRSAAEVKRQAEKFMAARSVIHQLRAMEAFMRVHHSVAVVAVLVIGLGAKQFFFPTIKAEADIPVAGIDTLEMTIEHPNRYNHPVQKMHDMTFVYSGSE